MKTTYAALVAAALFGATALAGTANAAPMAPLAGVDTAAVIKVGDMHRHRMHRMMRHEHRMMHRQHRMMRHMHHMMRRERHHMH